MRSFTMSIDRGMGGPMMNKTLSTQNLDRFRSMDDLGLKEKNSGVELVKLLRVSLLTKTKSKLSTMTETDFLSLSFSRRPRSLALPLRMSRLLLTTAER